MACLDFFHLIFSCENIYIFCTSNFEPPPPPLSPHTLSNGPSVPYQNRPEDTQNWTNLCLEPHDYRIYYVNSDLRHQYGISVAESQTFLRAKRLQRRRARRNGCFRRLFTYPLDTELTRGTWQRRFPPKYTENTF